MNRMRLMVVTVSLLLPGWLGAVEKKDVTLKVEGMTCGMCKAKVEGQLSGLCETVSADHKNGSAHCTLREGVKTDQVVEECNKTGFKCSQG